MTVSCLEMTVSCHEMIVSCHDTTVFYWNSESRNNLISFPSCAARRLLPVRQYLFPYTMTAGRGPSAS